MGPQVWSRLHRRRAWASAWWWGAGHTDRREGPTPGGFTGASGSRGLRRKAGEGRGSFMKSSDDPGGLNGGLQATLEPLGQKYTETSCRSVSGRVF